MASLRAILPIICRAAGESLCARTKSARLHAGVLFPASSFSSIGSASLRVLTQKAVYGHQFQFLVCLSFGIDLARAGAAPHVRLERLRLGDVTAVWIRLDQLGDRGERLRALAEPVLRVGLPVHRGVGLRSAEADDAAEALDRPVPPIFVERFETVVVCVVLALAGLARPLLLAVRRCTQSVNGASAHAEADAGAAVSRTAPRIMGM